MIELIYKLFFKFVAYPIFKKIVPVENVNEYQASLDYCYYIKNAPIRVVLGNVISVIFLFLSPYLLFKSFLPLHKLSEKKFEEISNTISSSKLYLLRVFFLSVKSISLIILFKNSLNKRDFAIKNTFIKNDLYLYNSKMQLNDFDYIVVGSGAGGATVSLKLREKGFSVLLVEEGNFYSTNNFYYHNVFNSFKTIWKDFGMQTAFGNSIIPVLQGKCVGGSTVMSGSIMHSLPEKVYNKWLESDKNLEKTLTWSTINESIANLEKKLNIIKNSDMSDFIKDKEKNLNKLGFKIKRTNILRSKNNDFMDQTIITNFLGIGGKLVTGLKLNYIHQDLCKNPVLEFITKNNKKIKLCASKASVLSLGAVNTPALLLKSGFINNQIGKNFTCNIGTSIIGMYKQNRVSIEGLPMGLECISSSGNKISTQSVPEEILLSRIPYFGSNLLNFRKKLKNVSCWTTSTISENSGSVYVGKLFSRPKISFSPNLGTMKKIREGLIQSCYILKELKAEKIFTQVSSMKQYIETKNLQHELTDISLDSKDYPLGISHIFGTCRIGSDPSNSVVNNEFEVYGAKNLFVVDASIFPTATGVNPQLSIMSIANVAGDIIINKTN